MIDNVPMPTFAELVAAAHQRLDAIEDRYDVVRFSRTDADTLRALIRDHVPVKHIPAELIEWVVNG